MRNKILFVFYWLFVGLFSTIGTFGLFYNGIWWLFASDKDKTTVGYMFLVCLICAPIAWILRAKYNHLERCDCGGFIVEDIKSDLEEARCASDDYTPHNHYRCNKCHKTQSQIRIYI